MASKGIRSGNKASIEGKYSLPIALEELRTSDLFLGDPHAGRIVCQLLGLRTENIVEAVMRLKRDDPVLAVSSPRPRFRVRVVERGKRITDGEDTISWVSFIQEGLIRLDRKLAGFERFMFIAGRGSFVGELEAMGSPNADNWDVPSGIGEPSTSARPLKSSLKVFSDRAVLVEIDSSHFREVILRNGGRTLENLFAIVCAKALESSDIALRAQSKRIDRLVASVIINLIDVGVFEEKHCDDLGMVHVPVDTQVVARLLRRNDHSVENQLKAFCDGKIGIAKSCDSDGVPLVLSKGERTRREKGGHHYLFDLEKLKAYSDFKI